LRSASSATRSTRCNGPRCSRARGGGERPAGHQTEVFLNIARRSQDAAAPAARACWNRMERRETKTRTKLEGTCNRVDPPRHPACGGTPEDLVISRRRRARARLGATRSPIIDRDSWRDQRGRGVQADPHPLRSTRRRCLGRAGGATSSHLPRRAAGERGLVLRRRTTRVVVGGQVLPNGYAVEIEDRGPSACPRRRSRRRNRKLVRAARFRPRRTAPGSACSWSPSLAKPARHPDLAAVRPRFGGVSAIVLIPAELIRGPSPTRRQLPPGRAGRPSDRFLGTARWSARGNGRPRRGQLAGPRCSGRGTESFAFGQRARSPGRRSTEATGGGGPNAGPAIPQTARPRQMEPAPPRTGVQRTRISAELAFGETPRSADPRSAATTESINHRPADSHGHRFRRRPLPSGPTPQARWADSVTADGLVQRRRAAPRRIARPGEDLARPAGTWRKPSRRSRRRRPEPAPPTTPAPPGSTIRGARSVHPGRPTAPDPGRRALAPQLRAPVEEEADTVAVPVAGAGGAS